VVQGKEANFLRHFARQAQVGQELGRSQRPALDLDQRLGDVPMAQIDV
jgi:hypothetical protein